MTALQWVFWSTLVLGLYPYAGYPVLARCIGALRRRTVAKDDAYEPAVTVLTAARDEAGCIEATLRNKLGQDYPPDRLDVVVVSDESTDGTDAIVERIADETGRVRLLRQAPRQGKTAALNLAVSHSHGDILIFSDANSLYARDAVRKLVSNFADPAVGYVTGKMVYVTPDGSLVGDGCSAYMKYENWLRGAETSIGSVVGVDGGVDAVRKVLYQPMRADQLPDLTLPLDVVAQGFRVVFEPRALLTEETLETYEHEFQMRVRVTLRALWALWDRRRALNPLRSGLFAWQLWSHKLLRYLSFAFLGMALLLNLALLGQGPVYSVTLAGQSGLLVLAALAWYEQSSLGRSRLARLCLYFVLVNAASAVATGRLLRRERIAVWQPRVG